MLLQYRGVAPVTWEVEDYIADIRWILSCNFPSQRLAHAWGPQVGEEEGISGGHKEEATSKDWGTEKECKQSDVQEMLCLHVYARW